jgi:5-(carboxyamino)imidazole ribonucleotide mutase
MADALVAILMGSKSDLDKLKPASDLLDEFGIAHQMRIMSAHRTPAATQSFVAGARDAGIKVLICAAGAAAHLAGAAAAHTTLPVIGLPIASTPLAGNDALLATVQMPRGMPVATVAIDNAYNAALLAIQIIAVSDADLHAKLAAFRKATTARVEADDAALQEQRSS